MGPSSSSTFPPLFSTLANWTGLPPPPESCPNLLLLVASGESEAGDVGPPVELAVADHDPVLTAGDLVEHGGVTCQLVPGLIDVGQRDRRPDIDPAAVGVLFARRSS